MKQPLMRLIGKTLIIALVITLVALTIGTRLHLWNFTFPKAAGPWTWNFSRAAGVTSYIALTLDVIFGLFISTGLVDRWITRGNSLELHQFLSRVSLSLIVGHMVALLGDRYVHFDLLDITIPLLSTYRPVPIALGIMAFSAAALVHYSFAWRKQLGTKVWRAIHYSTFVLFVLATVHGITAGSDSGHPAFQGMYFLSSVAIVGLTTWRVVKAVSKYRERRQLVQTQ